MRHEVSMSPIYSAGGSPVVKITRVGNMPPLRKLGDPPRAQPISDRNEAYAELINIIRGNIDDDDDDETPNLSIDEDTEDFNEDDSDNEDDHDEDDHDENLEWWKQKYPDKFTPREFDIRIRQNRLHSFSEFSGKTVVYYNNEDNIHYWKFDDGKFAVFQEFPDGRRCIKDWKVGFNINKAAELGIITQVEMLEYMWTLQDSENNERERYLLEDVINMRKRVAYKERSLFRRV